MLHHEILPTVTYSPLTYESIGRIFVEVADGVIRDLYDLETRLEGAKDFNGASVEKIGYGRGVEEYVDLIYSVAATASLAEYRRGEDQHRLPLLVDLDEVNLRLDLIRIHLQRLLPSAYTYFRSKRYRQEFAHAITTLCLALDAFPSDWGTDMRRTIQAFSPISFSSRDPCGDAQLYAETISCDPEEI